MDDILSVLIVEDEQPIREDLALYPWDESGAILVGEAANGREALEACDDVVPDVIVTDITMPRMNGIELMERVRERHPETVFIVLTCHEDFEYAQKALRLGAIDYVTKVAMRDEDLKLALDKARERVCAGKRLKASAWREAYWDRTSRFRAFLAGIDPLPEFIHLPSRLAVIHFVCQRIDATFANRYCQLRLERCGEPVWFSPGGMRCVLPVAEESDEAMRRRLVEIVRGLQENAESSMPYLGGEVRFFGSYSTWIDSDQRLAAEITSLDVVRDHAFYDEQQLVFAGNCAPFPPLDDVLRDGLELELRIAERSLHRLSNYLKNGLVIWGRKHRVKPDHLKSALISRRDGWKRRYAADAQDERFWTRLSGVSRLSELAHLLSREIEEGAGCTEREQCLRQEVVAARRIVREEYAESPTLTSVAERVGLSASYLSRLFSSETGRTFKDYLTEVRIAQAMELLRTPGIKVYEVAEAVGVPSYRHFSSMFRAMTGQRPKDYQKGEVHED